MVIKKESNKVGVSIIVVSYNTKDLLKNCIDSVIKFTKNIEYEIIIIDNNSTDKTPLYLKSISSQRNIKIVENKKNLGFGRANNIGLEAAKYDFILLLNSDTLLESNVIKEMVDYMNKDNLIGCASCSLKNSDGSIQGTGGYFPDLLRVFSWMTIQDFPFIDRFIKPFHPMKSRSFLKGDDFFKNEKELDWVTGAFMLMRSNAVKDTGYFDPDYFMYTEEVDFCFRMKKKGWKIMYNPKWSIVHLGGKSGLSGSSILMEFDGVKTFYKKHYSSWQYPLLRFILKVGCLGRMILFGIFGGKEDFAIYAKAFAEV